MFVSVCVCLCVCVFVCACVCVVCVSESLKLRNTRDGLMDENVETYRSTGRGKFIQLVMFT